MREQAAAKAVRILTEGRISVVRVDSDGVLALVRGDTAAIYTVTFNGTRWDCTCPALGRCSHALAVQRCVVVEPTWYLPALDSEPQTV